MKRWFYIACDIDKATKGKPGKPETTEFKFVEGYGFKVKDLKLFWYNKGCGTEPVIVSEYTTGLKLIESRSKEDAKWKTNSLIGFLGIEKIKTSMKKARSDIGLKKIKKAKAETKRMNDELKRKLKGKTDDK